MHGKDISQKEVNSIWSKEWSQQYQSKGGSFFAHRLFVEGYPIFKKYIPHGDSAKKLLDIGGGSGRYGLHIAMDFPSAAIIVADIVQESLELGARTAKEMKISNVHFEQQDINAMSYPDGHFDVVFCDVVIQHLPDVTLAMSEMRRVLKDNGVLIVSTMNQWNIHTLVKWSVRTFGTYKYGYEKSYRPKELEQLFTKNNFIPVSRDGFYPAYGIYRLKSHHQCFAFLGKVLNRITRLADMISERSISKTFGFEIFVVGRKKI